MWRPLKHKEHKFLVSWFDAGTLMHMECISYPSRRKSFKEAKQRVERTADYIARGDLGADSYIIAVI